MKKLYFIVALCAISFASFSQGRAVDVAVSEIISPKSIHSGTGIMIHGVVKNNGSEAIKTSDTILTRVTINNSVSSNPLAFRIAKELKMNDTMHIRFNLQALNVTGSFNGPFCMVAVGLNRSADSIKVERATAADNQLCETIWFTDGTSGIGTVSEGISNASVYPNPVFDQAIIKFTNPVASEVSIEVMDLTGKTVNVIEAGFKGSGEQAVETDFSELKAGVYFFKINAGEYSTTKKFIVK